MWNLIRNYFKSASFWVVVIFFFALIGLGFFYDKIFGVQYPARDWWYWSDLTVGDWIIVIIGMGTILSIPVYWIVRWIIKRNNSNS